MQLLVDFLCRFGFGLALGLVLTPATLVPPGFFRVNCLVVMGLATLAALAATGTVPAAGWILAAAGAVVAWLGSVAWLAGRVRIGQAACLAVAVALAAATWVAAPTGADAAPARLLSGAVVGLAVHAMLLGHWYLNAPGMRVEALVRMIDAALVAWGLALVLAAGGLAATGWPAADGSKTAMALESLRWLAGLVGLPVLLWMSRETLRIPNTQSATGILYVACLAAIVGELAGQLLAAGA